MKQALREISDMATSLEATGVDRCPAGAILEAIAHSIEKFAVTPERLREALEESHQALYERIKGELDLRLDGFTGEFDQRFDDLTKNTNERFKDVNRRIDDMRAEQRADSSRLFNLMLAIALGMASVAGSWLFGQFA